jgi:hypothetical protein
VQNEDDIAASMMTAYMHWQYEADMNLVKREAFKWTIFRPGSFRDEPGNGQGVRWDN